MMRFFSYLHLLAAGVLALCVVHAVSRCDYEALATFLPLIVINLIFAWLQKPGGRA